MQPYQIPRELQDICPPPEQMGQALKETKKVKYLSNLFSLTLLSQQVVATITTVTAIILYYIIQIFLFNASISKINANFIDNSNSVLADLFSCYIYISYMFIPFILQVFILKQNPFRIVPVRKFQNKHLILPSVCVVLSFAFISDLVTEYIQMFLGFIHLKASSPDFSTPDNLPAYIIFFIELCVLAPICEEFIFRGVILHNLRKFGDGFAIFVSALFFSMIHGNLIQMPLAFIVGIIFGILVIEFRSIWITVILHFCVNSLSVLVDGAEKLLGTNAANAIYLIIVGIAFFFAAAYIFMMVKRHIFSQKFAQYRKSVLPVTHLIKQFCITPGFIIFTGLTVLLVAAYIKII